MLNPTIIRKSARIWGGGGGGFETAQSKPNALGQSSKASAGAKV